jgi:hypothetical protein
MSDERNSNIVWTTGIENLVKSLGEKALSLSWLHNHSEKHFNYYNNCLAIPAIVLSTITATIGGTFAGDKTFSYVTTIISTIVSVLSTLNSYFVFAKRAEAHKMTAVSYSKLFLQIDIELSLPRTKRMNVKDFLKVVSEQIQRLNEIQPQVADKVIKAYNVKFKDEPQTISRPEITNGLVDIKIYEYEEERKPEPDVTSPIDIVLEPRPPTAKAPPIKPAFK